MRSLITNPRSVRILGSSQREISRMFFAENRVIQCWKFGDGGDAKLVSSDV